MSIASIFLYVLMLCRLWLWLKRSRSEFGLQPGMAVYTVQG
jgi:hypothetical protein